MADKIKHRVDGNRCTIEMLTNRFTHDLVTQLRNEHDSNELIGYDAIEFDLQQVKMIDSTSIGYLFELHNMLKSNGKENSLIIAVGGNNELKDLLHRFQVDMLLNVR